MYFISVSASSRTFFNSMTALQNSLWLLKSFVWHVREQYLALWHLEHTFTFSSDWQTPQIEFCWKNDIFNKQCKMRLELTRFCWLYNFSSNGTSSLLTRNLYQGIRVLEFWARPATIIDDWSTYLFSGGQKRKWFSNFFLVLQQKAFWGAYDSYIFEQNWGHVRTLLTYTLKSAFDS